MTKDELIDRLVELAKRGGGVIAIRENDWELLMGAYGANDLVKKIAKSALVIRPVREVKTGELSFRESLLEVS